MVSHCPVKKKKLSLPLSWRRMDGARWRRLGKVWKGPASCAGSQGRQTVGSGWGEKVENHRPVPRQTHRGLQGHTPHAKPDPRQLRQPGGRRAMSHQSCHEAVVHSFHHPIGLRVLGGGHYVVNAKGLAERGSGRGSELSTSVGCQHLLHAKMTDPTSKGVGAGQGGGLLERKSKLFSPWWWRRGKRSHQVHVHVRKMAGMPQWDDQWINVTRNLKLLTHDTGSSPGLDIPIHAMSEKAGRWPDSRSSAHQSEREFERQLTETQQKRSIQAYRSWGEKRKIGGENTAN